MPRIMPALGRMAFSYKKRELPENIDRILFFKIGALGDVLMTTPLVRAIRHRFPNAVIDYAVGKSFSEALRGNRNINYIIEFDERIFFTNNVKELRKLAQKLKENSYDVIFVLDKHWAAGVFASLAGSFRIGFDRNGEGFANNLNVFYKQSRHDIESYMDMGLYFKTRQHDTKMELMLTEKDRTFAKKICQKNCIAVAPGGGVNTGQKALIKVWPKEFYLRAINSLSKKYSIILIGGKDDRKISKWLRSHAKNKKKITDLCGRTTIKQTAAVAERCRLIICNDSGAMHIASCVNSRIISLFGPTNPHVLAPLNKGSTFIWKERKACYDICGKFDKCDRNIMRKITAEDVINAAKKYA